jgi:formate dehydrogenase major subunit
MGYAMAYASSRPSWRKSHPCNALLRRHQLRAHRAGGPPLALPNPEHPGTPILHIGQFSSGQGQVFHAIDFIPPAEAVDAEYPLYLTTGRVLYQYHTGTMTMKPKG